MSLGCTRRVVDEDGNLICADTGQVLGVAIDEGPDWNALRDREKGVNRVRAGVRSTLTHHTGAEHVSLELRKGPRLRRGRIHAILRSRRAAAQRGGYTYQERLSYDFHRRLEEAVSVLGLPREIHETAALMVRWYLEARALSGRRGERHARPEEIIAAAINQAAMLHQYSLEHSKIQQALGVPSLWRGTRELNRYGVVERMWRRFYGQGIGKRSRHIDLTKNFITAAVGSLQLPFEVATLAMEIIDKVISMGKGVEGRKPEALAGAAVYLAAHLYNFKVPQSRIAKVLSVKESAIRKQFRFILANLVILVKV